MLLLTDQITDWRSAIFAYRFSTQETLLAVCLAIILLMMLIQRRGQYTPFTRVLMDILAASAISCGLVIILMVLYS